MINVGEDAVHLQVHACVFLINLIICHNNEIMILIGLVFQSLQMWTLDL